MMIFDAPNFGTRLTMVVLMGNNAGDDKLVDGTRLGMVISDVVASRIGDIGDGRITFGVVVSKGGGVGDNGGTTCGA